MNRINENMFKVKIESLTKLYKQAQANCMIHQRQSLLDEIYECVSDLLSRELFIQEYKNKKSYGETILNCLKTLIKYDNRDEIKKNSLIMLNNILVKSLTKDDALESPESLNGGLNYFVYHSYTELFQSIFKELILTYDQINGSQTKDLVLIETIFNLLIFMVFVFWRQEENQVLSNYEEFTLASLNFLNSNAHFFVYKYSWIICQMFNYLRDGDFANPIVLDDLKYFENVKVLIKEGAGILEQLLLEQEHDTKTKINFIDVLISIGLDLNSDFLCFKANEFRPNLTQQEQLEAKKELTEICEKLNLNFKDLFNNESNAQNENYMKLFSWFACNLAKYNDIDGILLMTIEILEKSNNRQEKRINHCFSIIQSLVTPFWPIVNTVNIKCISLEAFVKQYWNRLETKLTSLLNDKSHEKIKLSEMFKWLCENSDPKVHSEVLNYVIEIFKTLFLTMKNKKENLTDFNPDVFFALINTLSQDLNCKEQIHELLDLFIQIQDTQDLNLLRTCWLFYWVVLDASINPEPYLKLFEDEIWSNHLLFVVDKLIECQFNQSTDKLITEYFFFIKFSENILRFLGSKISNHQKSGLKMFFEKLKGLDSSPETNWLAGRLEKLIKSVSN